RERPEQRDDGVMKHKNSHLLVGYWSRLRKGRAVPDQTDIDPRAIKRMLSQVFILDVQNPQRPIYRHRRRVASVGRFPNEADCSSFAGWCYWNGLHVHLGHTDIVNGEHWLGGYTGTMLEHGRRVSSPIAGDAIIYGRSWPGEHVAIFTGGGLVVSHGSEA